MLSRKLRNDKCKWSVALGDTSTDVKCKQSVALGHASADVKIKKIARCLLEAEANTAVLATGANQGPQDENTKEGERKNNATPRRKVRRRWQTTSLM